MTRPLLFLILTALVIPQVMGKEALILPKRQAHPLLARRIKRWIKELGSPQLAKQAKASLIRLGPIAADHLFRALIEEHDETKRKVIHILKQTHPPGSPQILASLLKNEKENPRVREEAATVLGYLGDEKVLDDLAGYVTHKDARIHKAAAYAVCRIGGKEAVGHLISLLKHWDKDIRKRAHQVLMRVTRENKPMDFEVWRRWWNEYRDIWEDS